MPVINTTTHTPSHSVRADAPSVQTVCSFTRLANATAYAANDVIGDGESSTLEFPNAVRAKGGSGQVMAVTVRMSGAPTAANLSVLIMTAELSTPSADNAAIGTMTATDIQNTLGIIPLTGSSAVSLGGYVHWRSDLHLPVAVKSATGTAALYGVLVAGGALTPVSAGNVVVALEIQQD